MDGIVGKVATVTGAAMGIGARTTEVLVQAGANVVAGDIAHDELTTRFGHARSVRSCRTDVRQRSDCETLASAAIDLRGRVDILINNAGITTRVPLPDTTDELWDNVLQTNLASASTWPGRSSPTCAAHGGGAIVNIASINDIAATWDSPPTAPPREG